MWTSHLVSFLKSETWFDYLLIRRERLWLVSSRWMVSDEKLQVTCIYFSWWYTGFQHLLRSMLRTTLLMCRRWSIVSISSLLAARRKGIEDPINESTAFFREFLKALEKTLAGGAPRTHNSTTALQQFLLISLFLFTVLRHVKRTNLDKHRFT